MAKEKKHKIEVERCLKADPKTEVISFRITKDMAKFMQDHKYSPAKVMQEALKMLGYKKG